MSLPSDIRKVIYTTNAIVSVNMSLRKITKIRGLFSTNDAVPKLFYLALSKIRQKWTMASRDWKASLNRSTLQVDECKPASNSTAVYTKFGTPFERSIAGPDLREFIALVLTVRVQKPMYGLERQVEWAKFSNQTKATPHQPRDHCIPQERRPHIDKCSGA